MGRAFLGLGSNLGDRWELLRDAVAALPDVVAVSSVYESEPVGGPEQGRFLNVVVELETDRTARELLAVGQEREQAADRVRQERWGPRTLDVDVVWVDGEVVHEPDLIVPHPRAFERAFVVLPLRELAPDVVPVDWEHPDDQALDRVGTLFAGPDVDRTVTIVGPGRAGRSLGNALADAGWADITYAGRDDDLVAAVEGARLVVIATPDGVVAPTAAALPPVAERVVLHLAGSLGLDALAGHERVAAVHPLVALPDPQTGSARLRDDAWFGVSGDWAGRELVAALDGQWVAVADADRARYHAAAVVASNHLVALLGQVERISNSVGVPLDAFLHLAAGSVDNVAELGAAAALTGPVARGDEATLDRHRAAIDPSELELYDALVAAARRLLNRKAQC